jgi:hypothetical protein
MRREGGEREREKKREREKGKKREGGRQRYIEQAEAKGKGMKSVLHFCLVAFFNLHLSSFRVPFSSYRV